MKKVLLYLNPKRSLSGCGGSRGQELRNQGSFRQEEGRSRVLGPQSHPGSRLDYVDLSV